MPRRFARGRFARGRLARKRGSALVFALWIALLLGVAGTVAMRLAAAGAGAARVEADLAAARAAAEGGIWAAAHRLAAEPLASRPPRAEFAFPIGRSEALVRAADEDGRIDLNAAGEPLLAALFRTAGMEERPAGALARALVDRRAEEAHRAGLRAVGELASLPGGTPALAEAVRGAATVHTGRARPAAEAAPAMAATALALEARAMPPLPSRSGGLRTPSPAQGEAGRRMIWRIESTGRSGAVEAHLAAVLQIAPGDGMPGRVLEWQPAAR